MFSDSSVTFLGPAVSQETLVGKTNYMNMTESKRGSKAICHMLPYEYERDNFVGKIKQPFLCDVSPALLLDDSAGRDCQRALVDKSGLIRNCTRQCACHLLLYVYRSPTVRDW
jgi:hypothetical protein